MKIIHIKIGQTYKKYTTRRTTIIRKTTSKTIIRQHIHDPGGVTM